MAAGVQENEEEGVAGGSLSRQQAVDEQRVAGGRWMSPEVGARLLDAADVSGGRRKAI